MSDITVSSDFVSFFEFFQAFVAGNDLSLPIKPQHQQICDVLERAVLNELPDNTDADGKKHKITYIVVNMPPRVGKTKIMEALACWTWAYFPDAQIISTSYSSSLVERSLKYIAETMSKPWFAENWKIPLKTQRADLLMNNAGGVLYGAGTKASITGFGAGLKREAGGYIGIDDPAKPDEALSSVEAENVRQWFETTLKSRRNSDTLTPIIVCAQRLAPEDLCGYLLQTYPLNCLHLKFPALVNGVSAIPETISTETLQSYQSTRTGRFVFASQYQQDPVALGGNLIPIDNFYRYDINQSLKFDKMVIPVDTALKTKQSNDFSVLQLWGLHNKRAYLVDSIRGKWEAPALIDNTAAFWKKHSKDPSRPRPRLIIEEKAAGTPLLQQLRKLGIPAEGIERNKDKVSRVQHILPFIETGMVYIPKDDQVPWLPAFLNEVAAFQADGNAPHDDQVDVLTDAIEHLLGRGLSIFDVLRSKVAK